MNCPVCNNSELKIAERQGIEIDYCPICRGVWLDRGELDKLIDRANRETAGRNLHDSDDGPLFPPRGQQSSYPSSGHSKKREGFWSNLFDFD